LCCHRGKHGILKEAVLIFLNTEQKGTYIIGADLSARQSQVLPLPYDESAYQARV